MSPDVLFSRIWTTGDHPVAHLIIVHGYAEHCGRYEALAREFNGVGIEVHAYDHRGHGNSPGAPGQIPRFDTQVGDLERFAAEVSRRAEGNPVFVLGHSMGGLVTAYFVAKTGIAIQGAIFSSPLLAMPAHVSLWLLRLSRVLGTVTPGLPVERLNSAGIARDVEVVHAYDADPQVYHGPIRARTGAELARAIQELPPLLLQITVPFLVFHGTADAIAPRAGSQVLFEGAASVDKECFFVEGGYHELLNDRGREEVIGKVLDWLARHGVNSEVGPDDRDNLS
jgi:acylglycerol lipase